MSGRRLYRSLYFWVISGVALGIALGLVPATRGAAEAMEPLALVFIKMVKMVIAPLIFCIVVTGIAKMGDMSRVGRVGGKCLAYFYAMTICALIIGLIVVNLYGPGRGMNEYAAKLQADQTMMAKVQTFAGKTGELSTKDFLMNIVPDSAVDAFAKGNILQVLFFSILLGIALAGLGKKAERFVRVIDELGQGLFKVVRYIMYFAPLGAFGAMAHLVATQGGEALLNLFYLMAGVYTTCIVFILGVLGLVCRLFGFSVWRFLRYIKGEILLVLATSCSEVALPRLMSKMEAAGVEKSVVGITLPMGYSFNLDGTCIYLTMAAVFLAQATNTPLDLPGQLGLLLVLLLTSKGAAAVTGGGFITLAATLQSVSAIPIASLTLLLGVDRFMSEARAITNLIGNGIATVVVAKWEKSLDERKFAAALAGGEPAAAPADPAVRDWAAADARGRNRP